MSFRPNRAETIIVIEPNTEARSRIVQAATVEKVVATTLASSSLHETLKLLRNSQKGDILFVSNRFPQPDVMHFVSAAKNTRAGQDAAYILLLDERHQDRATVAKHLLKGMDGFLAAPFTVDAMQRIILLALKVKLQRLRRRVEMASRLVLEKVMDELNYLAHDVVYCGKPFVLPERITHTGRVFRSLEPDELAVYFDVLIDMFSNASPPVSFVPFDAAADQRVFREVPDELEPLLLQLRDKDWRTRTTTLDKLAAMGAEAAPLVSVIAECLQDPRARCRQRAAATLLTIDTAEARQALKQHDQKRKSRT